MLTAHVWDISSSCQAFGVGSDRDTPTVILAGCDTIAIRWKSFPSLRHNKDFRNLRNTLFSNVVHYGHLLLNAGCSSFSQTIPVSFCVTYDGIYYYSGNSTYVQNSTYTGYVKLTRDGMQR